MVDIGLAIASFGFFIALCVIYYIDYLKGKEKKDSKIDPVSKGLMLSFLISGLMFLGEAFGFFEEGFNSKFLWLHFVIAVSLITIFMFVAKRKNPLPYNKQRKIAINYVKDEYYTNEYVGLGSISPLCVYKLTIEGNADETRGEVGNFLIELKADNIRKYWVAINIYNGALLHLQENPPLLLENRLLGKVLPVKRDQLLKEFDDEEKERDKSE